MNKNLDPLKLTIDIILVSSLLGSFGQLAGNIPSLVHHYELLLISCIVLFIQFISNCYISYFSISMLVLQNLSEDIVHNIRYHNLLSKFNRLTTQYSSISIVENDSNINVSIAFCGRLVLAASIYVYTSVHLYLGVYSLLCLWVYLVARISYYFFKKQSL